MAEQNNWLKVEDLRPTKDEWVDAVLADLDAFLIDHANCERKAAGMMMGLVAKFSDRVEIIPELVETAIEELEHFQSVFELLQRRGIRLPPTIEKDPYMQQLHQRCRHGRDQRFMDLMIICSLVEMRGVERFKKLAEHLQDEELKKYYEKLWREEQNHGVIFLELLRHYFDDEAIRKRLQWWIEEEARIIDALPPRPRVH